MCESCDEKCSACQNLHSCAEARQCFNDGHPELDPDGDGVPCESLCPGG
ncbi:MAG: excalibur calcium-binding domain-containing protein [Anaerolineae bacterium]|nr:excalibur calcium-binding domain-containing protein [Anaerolineae bacterium]